MRSPTTSGTLTGSCGRARNAAGDLVDVPVADAMDEIAGRLTEILDESGPRAIAAYFGTYVIGSMATSPVANMFMDAIGSPMRFTPNTIDKPGKPIARRCTARGWRPARGSTTPTSRLLVGANPLVTYTGLPNGNPGRWLGDALRRGMQLVVIDPRRTDVARRATVHLQPRPARTLRSSPRCCGSCSTKDSWIASSSPTTSTASTSSALPSAPFTPAAVARRADVDADDLVRAARIFGTAARGYAFAGTGPNMTGQGTLVEYLVLNLFDRAAASGCAGRAGAERRCR